jgi:UDP-GlcNAc:undecaprenyl-phosphate GlcNAc-1-phosphate transferase
MSGLATFISAFVLSYAGTMLLLKVRLRRSFIDVPNERSSHETPKPRIGGIAMVGACIVVLTVLLIEAPSTHAFLPLLLGGSLVFAAGVLDDRRSVPAWVRLGVQLVASILVIASGNIVHHIYLPLVGTMELGVTAIPFTMLFVVASINFYNFVDGIDGLAAGSAFITAVFLSLIAYMLGHPGLGLVCLALAGVALGFLQFNFPPSKLFMGDSGSTFLGFAFAYLAVTGNQLQPEIPFFIPVLILSSLYLDAGLTLARRALRGERIFQPHHTHYYQRLLSLGLNHKQVTVLEYALTTMLGASALVFFKAGGFFPAFLLACWIAVFTVLILKIRSLERGDRLFWERRTLLVVGSDLAIITLAYFGAYFLRMNFRFTEAEGMAVLKAFPIVLVVRSACFFWYGLYRGVWKYTSTPDVVRIIKAVTTGSAVILVLLVLFYRFVAFPRSLFVIEYFLLIIGIGGSRFASRLFHEFGREALGGGVRRVGILGAGDYGERLAREIRSAEGRTVSVVCYIDDDPRKIGLTLQGVPIVGPLDDLVEICRRFEVRALVNGMTSVSVGRLKSIVRDARTAGVDVETRAGHFARKKEPALVLFDRVGRGLGRQLPFALSPNAAAFYRGKRVLVTQGGESLGPALARELQALGAEVVVQVQSPWEAERFADGMPGSVGIFVGGIERELDAARVLGTVDPQIVLHCAGLSPVAAVNRKDYLFRRFVRTTEALCTAAAKHPLESIAFLEFRPGGVPGAAGTGLAVLGEARFLNSHELIAASPKVVRLPDVLTETRLRTLAGKADGAAFDAARRYRLLEVEAVALCLGAAAVYHGRVLLVPGLGASVFTEADVSAALQASGGTVPAGETGEASGDEGLLLPVEMAKPSVLPGAREVMSPIYPASEPLMEWVSQCSTSSRRDLFDEPWEKLHAVLLGRSAAGIETPVD